MTKIDFVLAIHHFTEINWNQQNKQRNTVSNLAKLQLNYTKKHIHLIFGPATKMEVNGISGSSRKNQQKIELETIKFMFSCVR